MPYTLVQHTGFTVGGKPAFRNAVEARSVQTKKQERAVRRAGGLIYRTYSDAREAEQSTNFPPEVKGLIPRANGRFVTRSAFDEPIFIPNI